MKQSEQPLYQDTSNPDRCPAIDFLHTFPVRNTKKKLVAKVHSMLLVDREQAVNIVERDGELFAYLQDHSGEVKAGEFEDDDFSDDDDEFDEDEDWDDDDEDDEDDDY